MKWTPLRITALKLALFCSVLGYMALDLMVIHGPVYGFLHPAGAVAADEALSVYGEPVSRAQFARYAAEQNLLSGRKEAAPSKTATMALGMVYDAIIRTRTRYNDLHLSNMRKAAEEEVAQLSTRCASPKNFEAKLASQGYTLRRFTERMQARLREEEQLERALESYCKVDNAAVAAHYKQLREELTIPPARPVRHIFFATEGKEPEAVKQQAELTLQRLQAGESFADLAKELSEDERSAPAGGSLGVIHDDGRTPLAELPLFGENAVAAGEPSLVQSRWGWHILLAGPITPAYTPSLDEARETLRTAILSAQRELGLRAYLDATLKEGFQQKRIQIHVK